MEIPGGGCVQRVRRNGVTSEAERAADDDLALQVLPPGREEFEQRPVSGPSEYDNELT